MGWLIAIAVLTLLAVLHLGVSAVDDAAGVLCTLDLAHSLCVLGSKSGTTL